MRTHPLPESRVADARTRAASYRTGHIPPSINFHLAQARIIARYYANPTRNIDYFSRLLDKKRYVFKQAAQYGLALSYLADEQLDKAQSLINELIKSEPNNLFFLDTYTDIAIETKQHQKAIKKLEALLAHRPYNKVLTLNLANIFIQSQNAEQAIALLKDYLLINPSNMLAYELLSDAYKQIGQQLEMHQIKAEVYALVAAYPRAIDELHNAYNFAGDRQLEKQRIRARIEQFRSAQERLQSL